MLSVSNAKHRISRGDPDKFGHFRPEMQNIVNALQRIAAMVAYPYIALTHCLTALFPHGIKVGTDLAYTSGNQTTDSVYRRANYA
ncbi:MAG: hypothetical protein ACI9BC_002486 [Crocinitomicaceae bacterium]|jgi:hypothetical protein